MARIFSLLSTVAVVMILLAGSSVYWFSLPDVEQAKQARTETLAKGISLNISSYLNILQQSIDGIAQSPEVIAALESQNKSIIINTEKKLEKIIPFVLKIRLLPANINEIDNSNTPHMGFADLEMIHETLLAQQKPGIQGEDQHRHLAITSKVSNDGEVLGTILASFPFDFVKNTVNQITSKDTVIEVKQDRTLLAMAGKNSDDKLEANNKITIPHSKWVLYYHTLDNSVSSNLSLIASAIALSSLIACLAFFIGYRKLTEYLRQDQSSIIKAAKDMMAGKTSGNYPVLLNEMKPIISTLSQYKRVIDNQDNNDFNADENHIDDSFFDDGLDTSFLDVNRGVEVEVEDNSPKILAATETQPQADNSQPVNPVYEPVATPFSAFNNISHIFRAYDIRGIVDQSLTTDIVYKIGQAIGSEAKLQDVKTIVIGRDGRSSSRVLSASLAEGILSTGRDVLDIAMIPSPVLYFVTHHSDGGSGVMITGSHNPANYNGLKMILKGETLADDKIQKLKQRIENDDFESGVRGSIEQNSMFTNEYIGIISEDIHIVRPMKIVLDCGNGVAGELAPVVLKTIGCEVIELYCDVDGAFPNHHPDPSKPENLQDLIAAVKYHEADVGIALDGDGDRLGIVDSHGKIIWPDRQMMLFAKNVLSDKPGSEIIFDVKCSRHLGDQIVKYGGRPLMWKTGHSLMKAKLKETGAALAGEMSGHIFFNDRWFGFDDGIYAAARMIEILSADSRPSNVVFADFPDSINTPELTVDMAEGENFRFIEQMFLAANFQNGNILNIDGMRVDFDDGWGLVRASNTTPSLVIRFEADNREALQRIQEQFRSLMLQIKPDISLPF